MGAERYSAWKSLRARAPAHKLTPFDVIGVVLLTAVLAATNGVPGFLAGALILVVAAVSSGPAAFAVAQVCLVSILPSGITQTAAGTQFAAFFLLAGVAMDWPPELRRFGEVVATYLAALGIVWLLSATLRWVWQSALLLVVLAAAVSYALYRYERVAVGLVPTGGSDSE